MHDRGALSEVSTEADAVGVANADAVRHDIVHHARELVHRVDGNRAAGGQAAADHLEVGNRARAVVGPYNVGQQTEDAVHVQAVRLDRAVGEEVEAQVCVVCI